MSDNFFLFIETLMLAPEILFLVLLAATFILEDAATVAAVGMAVAGVINPIWAYVAVLSGIIIGDVGLYYIGRGAEKNKWMKRKTEKYDLEKYRKKIQNHSVIAILTSRFIPGARTPTYLAMGYFHVSFTIFFLTAAVAVSLWTTFLFWGLYYLGDIIAPYVSGWTTAFIAIFIVTFYTIITNIRSRKKQQD